MGYVTETFQSSESSLDYHWYWFLFLVFGTVRSFDSTLHTLSYVLVSRPSTYSRDVYKSSICVTHWPPLFGWLPEKDRLFSSCPLFVWFEHFHPLSVYCLPLFPVSFLLTLCVLLYVAPGLILDFLDPETGSSHYYRYDKRDRSVGVSYYKEHGRTLLRTKVRVRCR